MGNWGLRLCRTVPDPDRRDRLQRAAGLLPARVDVCVGAVRYRSGVNATDGKAGGVDARIPGVPDPWRSRHARTSCKGSRDSRISFPLDPYPVPHCHDACDVPSERDIEWSVVRGQGLWAADVTCGAHLDWFILHAMRSVAGRTVLPVFIVLVVAAGCGAKTTSVPTSKPVPLTAYAGAICKDARPCCETSRWVSDEASCESMVAAALPTDSDERAKACMRLIEQRTSGCNACRTPFDDDELNDACSSGGSVYWGWTDEPLQIGAGALSHGGGSQKIGESCESSVDCEAPTDGFVRCIHTKQVDPSDSTKVVTTSFCQSVKPMAPDGQPCLTFGWTPTGPTSWQELHGVLAAGSALNVVECGLPGSHTVCFNTVVSDTGTCVSRPNVGASCFLPGNEVVEECSDGTYCDGGSVGHCAADTPGSVCPDAEWQYGICGTQLKADAGG